jgi:hypothetical protein
MHREADSFGTCTDFPVLAHHKLVTRTDLASLVNGEWQRAQMNNGNLLPLPCLHSQLFSQSEPILISDFLTFHKII